jgi:hypothetical protein
VIDSGATARATDAVAHSSRDEAGDAPTRRLWVAPAAVAAIVVLVVGAALSSGSNDDHASRHVASATSAPTSTTDPARRTADSLHLVADTPRGFLVDSVGEHTPVGAGAVGATRELWATHTDSADRSSWFVITAGVRTGDDGLVVGERRLAVPAGVAVLGHQPNGTLSIAGPITGGGEATVTSSGLSQILLTSIFGTLQRANGQLVHDDPMFGGTFQLVGADGSTAGPVNTDPIISVRYRGPGTVGGQDVRFSVSVGKPSSTYERNARRFFLSRRADVNVGSATATVGYDTRTTGDQSLVIERYGLEITVDGTAQRDVLVAAATSIHVASANEWQDVENAAFANAAQPDSPFVTGARMEVSNGLLADGTTWIISVIVGSDVSIDSLNLESQDGITNAPLGDHTSGLAAFAVDRFSAVVAQVPKDQVGAVLQVTLANHTVSIPMVDVGADTLIAAYGFDVLTPYTARIVAADGSSISSITG